MQRILKDPQISPAIRYETLPSQKSHLNMTFEKGRTPSLSKVTYKHGIFEGKGVGSRAHPSNWDHTRKMVIKTARSYNLQSSVIPASTHCRPPSGYCSVSDSDSTQHASCIYICDVLTNFGVCITHWQSPLFMDQLH